ncbi:hypothetical protein FISHEDRAFT_45947 [Fistulina hepatica ATCC 64428]|uniref:Aminoglycoside phosphotransferase domain-containing protein n=1 Tax=Fistulina hepatica ATCC 64428 TaxID=1128425 RepID=A0A0D7A8I7_9AGAR|nr:hypothetical protein FISHEDRAFT_45947 [Fistulina hepatica ATCC 64428]
MACGTEIIGERFPGQPTRDQIIRLCFEKGREFKGLTYPPNGCPVAYIKYGFTVTMGEAQAQLFALQSGARVPRIHHAFMHGQITYILMEYIDGMTVSDWLRVYSDDRDWVYNEVANAVSQMLGFTVPQDAPPGPIGGGLTRHSFFQDFVAFRPYASVKDLEEHINKALNWTAWKDRVSFSRDKLIFYYSDINDCNFLITKDRQLYVIDFQDAGFLPESFMSLTLHKPRTYLAGSISALVPLSKSANLETLSYASYLFQISSGKNRPT